MSMQSPLLIHTETPLDSQHQNDDGPEKQESSNVDEFSGMQITLQISSIINFTLVCRAYAQSALHWRR